MSIENFVRKYKRVIFSMKFLFLFFIFSIPLKFMSEHIMSQFTSAIIDETYFFTIYITNYRQKVFIAIYIRKC